MREEYDLSDAKRHPLAGQFKGKYTAIVHYDINENKEASDETPTTDSAVLAEAVSEHIQKKQ